jgi:hypothetical protein
VPETSDLYLGTAMRSEPSLHSRDDKAAHITGMPATLTITSAAELAATLAHTSALLGDDDAGYPAFRR